MLHPLATTRGNDSAALVAIAAFVERSAAGERLDLLQRLELGENATEAEARLAASFNALLARMRADLSELSAAVTAVSTAGRSQELLTGVADDAAAQVDRFTAVLAAVDESARGAHDVSGLTRSGSDSADGLRDVAHHSSESVYAVLEQLAQILQRCEAMRTAVVALDASVTQIGELAETVNGIAERTNLLSLNAAIEAARAKQHGAGFAIVAAEIRKLADSAASSTQRIRGNVRDVVASSAAARAGVEETVEAVARVAGESSAIRGDLERMLAIVNELGIGLSSIAAVAEQQSAALGQVVTSVADAKGTASAGADRAKALRELGSGDLHLLTCDVFARYRIGDITDRMYDIACDAADAAEAVLERAIPQLAAAGTTIFSTDYRELRGAEIARLSALCDVSRADPGGFTPPKYFTPWDTVLDADLAAIVDDFGFRDDAIRFMCIVDVNGFLAMHRKDYRQPITGDPAVDLSGNRVKRFVENDVALRAARVGLAADDVPKRASRARFRLAGVELDRVTPATSRPRVVQSYRRDTDEIVTDLGVPLFAGGRRWGALRVSFRPEGS